MILSRGRKSRGTTVRCVSSYGAPTKTGPGERKGNSVNFYADDSQVDLIKFLTHVTGHWDERREFEVHQVVDSWNYEVRRRDEGFMRYLDAGLYHALYTKVRTFNLILLSLNEPKWIGDSPFRGIGGPAPEYLRVLSGWCIPAMKENHG